MNKKNCRRTNGKGIQTGILFMLMSRLVVLDVAVEDRQAAI